MCSIMCCWHLVKKRLAAGDMQNPLRASFFTSSSSIADSNGHVCTGWRCCLRSGCCPSAARTTSGRWATRAPAAPAPVRHLCRLLQRRSGSGMQIPAALSTFWERVRHAPQLDGSLEDSATISESRHFPHVTTDHHDALQSCTTIASAGATLRRWSTRTTPMCWRSGTSCSSRCLQCLPTQRWPRI